MRTFLRVLLLRILPRRLVPILAVWEVYQLIRGRRRDEVMRETQPAPPAARRSPRRKPLW